MSKIEVSNYDGENYDYKEYWNNREYEDKAEKELLNKLMYNMNGKRFIDIGGSFGRNAPLYADKYKQFVIMDYSLQTLLKYEKNILENHPNAILIAGNAYKPPFKSNSFDGGMTIRVLHHLQDPETYFKAISKILSNKAKFIQEIPNKVHLKARTKWLLSGKFSMLNTKPYTQPSANSEKEGSSEEGIFLNYHPRHIRNLMKSVGFSSIRKSGASYFRIPKLKEILPINVLLYLEVFAQNLLKWSNIAPSIFFKATLDKKPQSNNQPNKSNKEESKETLSDDFLCCPECGGDLNIKQNTATCKNKNCRKTYQKHSTVWDLRA